MTTTKILTWGLVFTFIGCGGRPTELLQSTQDILANAELSKKCAPEEYAAAENMYAKAQKLADDGEYDEAEKTARAAQKLAKKAADSALARKAECERPKAVTISTDQFVENENSEESEATDDKNFEIVYFDFNAANLNDSARNAMQSNAKVIRLVDANTTVIVEGHCDSRGSTEYNLALGEKRAMSAKQYLIELGVDESRLEITSYGEERLDDYGDSETAHRRNRRVQFKRNL